jgi:hypothetical protein
LEEYLSPAHRSRVGEGCLLPTLSIDAARAGTKRKRFSRKKLRELVDESSEIFPDDLKSDQKRKFGRIWR